MTIIANPIYDAVFKFLLEDKKVAIILLSALLKKEIVELEMCRHEYTSMEQTRISLFRIDFSARVRESDGSEHLVLIELQKTWLITETLRFRQYLGTQYLNKDNVIEEQNEQGQKRSYGLPIVSIYILGHKLGDLTEPVVYVRRRYLDYDDNVLPSPDRFIEGLTHDSIIVQIPFLAGKTRNHLERLLSVFDQDFCRPNEHYLEVDEAKFSDEAQYLVHRLLKAAAAPDIRRAMQIEDEILSEIEARDTTIMMKNMEIEKKVKEVEEKAKEVEEKTKEVEEKTKEVEEKTKEVEEKTKEVEEKTKEVEEKAKEVEEKNKEIEQNKQVICLMVKMLYKKGISLEEISQQLSIPVEQIEQYIRS